MKSHATSRTAGGRRWRSPVLFLWLERSTPGPRIHYVYHDATISTRAPPAAIRNDSSARNPPSLLSPIYTYVYQDPEVQRLPTSETTVGSTQCPPSSYTPVQHRGGEHLPGIGSFLELRSIEFYSSAICHQMTARRMLLAASLVHDFTYSCLPFACLLFMLPLNAERVHGRVHATTER